MLETNAPKPGGFWNNLPRLSATSLMLFGTAALFVGCGKAEPNSATRTDSRSALYSKSSTPMLMPTPSGELEDLDSQESEPEWNTETYDSITENPFYSSLEQPLSTFSIDVDTASYANVRRFLRDGKMPVPGAVRLEELVNYFRYDYPVPSDGEHPFAVATEVGACPWAPGHSLIRIGLQGAVMEPADRPSSNLVFLLDVSGSMLAPNKLPLVKSAMKMLTKELSENDRIAIVVYAGASGLALDSTPASDGATILAAIEELSAGGSTNGGEGIELAYGIAAENYIEGGINRVILCTDGDFNVGTTNQSQLVELIEEKAQSNVFLSVLGFGDGNLKDSTMEKLADKGNGNYAYIDSMLEARKVLVEEIGSTLVTIAKDVKIQVDFNPLYVEQYRLLGYENRRLENRDFRDDSKDAGEIGAGHSVTAFYELIPAPAEGASASSESEFVSNKLDESADRNAMLTVNLRYKQPEGTESSEFQHRVPASQFTSTRLTGPSDDKAQTVSSDPELSESTDALEHAGDGYTENSTDFQFATAVLGYGMLLRQSEYATDLSWDWVIDTAEANRGADRSGLRAELVQLAKTARRIAASSDD